MSATRCLADRPEPQVPLAEALAPPWPRERWTGQAALEAVALLAQATKLNRYTAPPTGR
jgi:hypothetical protein